MARAAGALAEVGRWACRVKLSAGRLTGRPLSVLISPGQAGDNPLRPALDAIAIRGS